MNKIYTSLVSFGILHYRLLLITSLIAGLAGANKLRAQLSGVKNIPGDYATITLAVTDLNAQGVGAGGVVFNIAAGYTETITATISVTATGTIADPITFQKSGVGANPLITSYTGGTGTPGSAVQDGIFNLIGSDYVTIDGIDLMDNPANTSNPSTMEYGYSLYKASATNGCNHVTIKNCTITLNRINNATGSGPAVDGSRGIEMVNALSTAATTIITVTAASGSNSDNRFYNNTIQNCNIGISLIGYAASSPFDLADTNNDVGGSAPATGNTIINFGGAPAATNPAAGVRTLAQYGLNVSYNTVNNNNGAGVNHVSTLRGIYVNTATSASATISYNQVTMHGGGTTAQISFIENVSGSTAAGNTIHIHHNMLSGDYITATSGTLYGIYSSASPAMIKIENNTISGITYSDLALTGSGTMYTIYNSGSATNAMATSNTVENVSRFGTSGGTTIGIYLSSGTTQTAKYNLVHDLSIDGSGSSSTLYGIQVAGTTVTADTNTIYNLMCLKTTGSSAMYGLYNISGPTNENYNGNIIHDLMHAGTGTTYGIYTFTATGTRTVSKNLIYNISSGGTLVSGINQASSSPSIYKNKIYNVQSSSTGAPTVSGISITSLGTSGIANVYNNLIGDIKAPFASSTAPTSPSVRGLNITTTTSSTTFNVSYNTISLNASTTGTNFSTTGVYATTSTTATTATLNLRNNVIENLSVPKGTGFTVAYQRSSTTLTNYGSASDKNLFFAGGPCSSRLIHYDGTNALQTLADYKNLAGLAPRDANSVTEDPNLLSNNGSSPNFLHVSSATATQIEGNALVIAGITEDFDGDVRNGTTPDLGADEISGIQAVACAGMPTAGTATASPATICSGMSTDICLSGQTAAEGISYKWQFSLTSGGPYSDISCTGAACVNTGALAPGTYYYVAVVTCNNSGLSAMSNEVTVTVNGSPAVSVSPSAPSVCIGSSVNLTASGANTYVWAPSTFLNTSMGANVISTPSANITYTVTGTDLIGCTGTTTVAVSVKSSPAVSASATPATICAGENSQLEATDLVPKTANNYVFTPGTGAALDPMAGATQVLGSSNDDTPTASPAPIGFTFNFEGVDYTDYSVSPDGWLLLGTTTAVSQFTNAVTSSTNIPKLYPYWDDLATGADGNVQVLVTGSAPNRIFIVQWFVTIPRNTTGNANSTFQAWLYETSGKIEFRYGAMGTPTSNSISGGITGNPSSNYNSLTFTTNTSSSTAANDVNTIAPPNGTIYTYVPPSLMYAWSPVTFLNNPNIANPLASGVSATTTYTVTATSVNGCTATASATVTTNPIIAISETDMSGVANNDGIICAGGSATLTASGGSSYMWSSGDNMASTTVSPVTTTTYTVTVSDGMCAGTKTFTVTVNPLPTPSIAVAEMSGNVNNDGIICNGASVTLTASGGTSYSWNTGETTAAITKSPMLGTTYTVTVTNSNGCAATASQTITVNPLPTALISPSPASVCLGQSVTLTASGGTGYAWSTGSNTASTTVSPVVNTTYTVTVTDGNGCTSSTTVVVSIDPAPTYTVVVTQPTSCFTADGAIDLTLTGGVSPYTFNWTTPNGSGINQGQEDQSGITVGTYFVTITGNNGCTTTASFNLSGPGGCFSCPTLGSLSDSPTGAVCANSVFTLTENGLLDMGSTYGIIFKYSSTALPDPYVGGTILATVSNANLGGGGTFATANVSIPTGGTYFIYAILDPTPTDGACRPFSSITKVINPTPDAVATPPSQTICSGSSITTIALTGSVPGTSYSWTRDNTASVTGIAASGMGDISGTLTNTTNAAVTVTFTITPSANGCQGSPIMATVVVNPLPQVNAVANMTYCVGSIVPQVVFTSNVSGATFSWSRTNEAIGLGTNSGTGNVPSFTATNAGTAPLTATFSVVATYTNNGVSCNGTPIQFTITVNPNPTVNAVANMAYCVGATVPSVVFTSNVPGATFSWSRTNEAIGLGVNSGTGNVPSFTAANAGNTPLTATFSVVATYTNNGVSCNGTPIQFTITVNPSPVVTATPPSQTICSGNAITTIALSSNVSGSTITWTRNNTATVTGIAASGSGNISGSLTNTTNAPITVTFTITGTANSCPGNATTATVLVNPTPAVFAVTGGGGVCTTDNIGAAIGLSGSQTNVNYRLSLNGVPVGAVVAGTGNAISFGTFLAAGTYTAVATHAQGGCMSTMTGSAVVSTFNCTVSITDPCICLDNATTLINGQFGETIKVNAPGTQTWTIQSVTGLYQNGSPAPPAAPVPFAANAALTNLGAAMNMFELKGKHVDAIGYTVTVTNGLGTSLTIGNACQYPNPSFTVNLSGDYCLNSDPVTLTGDPGDANIISQGFTVNGVPATQFDPGQGVGQYVIAYIVNGGTPKAFGPNDPGCTQTIKQFVNVVQTPSTIYCNDQVYVSLPASCTGEIMPDDILEGTYGCFDDYVVELDKTLPYGDGPWLPSTLSATDIGKTYQARVTHLVSGNKCWGSVTIQDKLAPKMTCQDFHLICPITTYDPSYLSTVLGIAAANPVVTDCSSFSKSYTDTWFDLACGGTINGMQDISAYVIRKWTAIDQWGNSTTCQQYIYFDRKHVTDVIFPIDVEITCGQNINTDPSVTGAPYLVGFNRQWPLNPGAGFCEMQAAYSDQILPVCDGTYKILRTWTVLDWCLPTTPTPPYTNPQYYIQLIKVVDLSGPAFTCPANTTVSIDPFQCCATVDMPDRIIEDGCSRVNNISGMVVTFDQYTGQQSGMYTFGGTLSDFPGNNWWNRDTMGNWGSTPCLPIGTHTVTYIAEDDCGNSTTCSFKLTVADFVPPVAACDQTTTVGIGYDDPHDCYTPDNGCAGAGVTWVKASTFNDGSYDDCHNVKMTIRRMSPYSSCINDLDKNSCYPNGQSEYTIATAESDSIKFYCCEVGTTQTVILRVYQVDVNGNLMNGIDGSPLYNECMIQVEVQDKQKPFCSSPSNVTVSCETFDPSLWLYGKASVLDNCCLDETKVYQGQCGLTHSVNYSQFDTLCNKGTIVRTFRAFDCHGQSSQCTQRIVVNYEQDYYVRFPNDVIITVCDGTGNYGEPTFFGEDCELLGVSYEDEVFTVVPDACFKIERQWKIINWCTYDPNGICIDVPNPSPNAITNHASNLPGPIVSPIQTSGDPWKSTIVKIKPSDATATNYSIYYNPNANCYTYKQIIKIIDTQDPIVDCPASPVTICDLTSNDAQLWNASYWWDNANQSHDLCEAPSDICITATDLCSGSNINIEYQLFLDLDGDGVMETVVNSTQLGNQAGGLGWNNIMFGNLTGAGQSRQFDGRPVPTNQKWGFAIQETVTGNNKTACVKFNTFQNQTTYVTPQLPHGTHKIKWFVSDGCGNETVCEYTIIVKDCKAPTVVCLNGLSVNIMPTGMIQLWATDFLQYADDNCTLAPYLKYGIRKCGQGTGFPVDAQGNPITNVTFDCTELGTQCVELWAIDLAGNADYCETYVIVQDNNGNCPNGSTVNVSGFVKTETQDGVEEANIGINNAGTITGNNGFYQLMNSVPMGANVSITPFKDDNPLNGVTTYDLVLISKHILGIEPLGSPYKMIAADANKSNSITTFDVVELRKLILGIYQELPNNTSWRFVDKAQVFANPDNPFMGSIKESISVPNAVTNLNNEDFVGVKVGDVNNTAVANSLMVSNDRTSGTLLFDVSDRDVTVGEEFEVNFIASEKSQGYQMTLNLNGLKVSDLTQGDNSGKVDANNFGVFADALTVSIDGAENFTVKFRAEKAGKLSDMLGVSSRITKAEAYSMTNDRQEVALRFDGKTIAGVGFELYQNQPNPFVNKTFIGFHLPEDATAVLSVYDETGRIVFTQKGDFAKGYNVISLDKALINGDGLLYYTLESGANAATKKMIRVR
ncbi:MAG: HYR domain-containing protein [Lewinellaceae bacterium]|nr:HYR domain-containing protein [Lewinellaceae bacterium]